MKVKKKPMEPLNTGPRMNFSPQLFQILANADFYWRVSILGPAHTLHADKNIYKAYRGHNLYIFPPHFNKSWSRSFPLFEFFFYFLQNFCIILVSKNIKTS